MSEQTVLIGSVMHETNTFVDELTDRAAFQRRYEHFGADIPANLEGTSTSVGGAIAVARERDVDLIYTVAANATPGGPVAADAYEFYTDRILSGVRDHLHELDGVVLPLHGAMVPDGTTDGEGPLVARIRDVVGPDIPISVALDLHGNNTDELFDAADAVVGYETYPHVDMGETGRTAMEILLEIIRGEIDPVMHVERPPVIPYGTEQNTRTFPMARVMARARDLESRDEIRNASVFPGFLLADVPSMSVSISVVADDDLGAARTAARELAELIWSLRDEFVGEYVSPDEAVRRAAEIEANLDDDEAPVLMAELGPMTGAGGAGDGTTLLRAMIEREATNAGYATIRDPEAIDACVEAGVGSELTVTIGGKTDDRHGDPIEDVTGHVKSITDGVFVNTGRMGKGATQNLGRAVRFQCGAGIDVILTDYRHQPYDLEIWRHVGIDPERLDLIGIASQNHFRAAYEPIVNNDIIMVESPGLGIMDPTKFDYENVTRPKFPIDDVASDDYPDW